MDKKNVGPCTHCRKRVAFRRTLCKPCYLDPEVRGTRESAFDSLRAARPGAEAVAAVVNDPDQFPAQYLWGIAHEVARKFGPQVDPEDLYQVGAAGVIKSIGGWLRASRPADPKKMNAVHYAARGVRAAMYAYAVREVLGGVLGRKERVPAGARLRGGLPLDAVSSLSAGDYYASRWGEPTGEVCGG